MIMTMTNFRFGIDPSGFVPDREKPLHLKVEDVGEYGFANALEPITMMAAIVSVMTKGRELIINDAKNMLTITAWDEKARKLSVKLN